MTDAVATHPLVLAAGASLDTAGVGWAILRGFDRLDRPSGDVDVLVAAGRGADVDRALRGAGYLRLREWADGGQRFFVAFDEGTGDWVHLHVVDRLGFGPYAGLELEGTAEAVLGRRRPVQGVWALAPSDEWWVTLLHGLLDKGALAERHRARLAALLEEAAAGDAPVAAALGRLGLPPGIGAERQLDRVRQGRWTELERAAGDLRRAWEHADPMARVRRRRHRRQLWLRKAVEPVTARGLQVALLAPDGAGKSTVTRLVADGFFFDVRVLYLGLYGAATPIRDLPVPGAGFAQRVAWMWARFLLARYHQARRRLVLFDRHPLDARVTTGAGGGRSARRAVLGRSLPQPDLVVVLDAPGEVLSSRKGEHDPAESEARRQGYLALAASLRGAEVVDATAGADAVALVVTGLIWRRYLARAAG